MTARGTSKGLPIGQTSATRAATPPPNTVIFCLRGPGGPYDTDDGMDDATDEINGSGMLSEQHGK